ncbi:MAG: hypothetical protein LBC72_01970, partial [Spirochaetaceae bacterium]|nr:hypothetical protein [Spirochaetaceae bacterium]
MKTNAGQRRAQRNFPSNLASSQKSGMSNKTELAPVVLFVYNRPEHTLQTLEALKKNTLASESILYIFADGPKKDAQ